jgi:hypothetical protein
MEVKFTGALLPNEGRPIVRAAEAMPVVFMKFLRVVIG